MSAPVCYVGTSFGIDGKIAEHVEGYTPQMVATVRAIYDQTHKRPLIENTEDLSEEAIREAVNKWSKYNTQRRKDIHKSLNRRMTGSRYSRELRTVKRDFSFDERTARSAMIRVIFGDIVDAAVEGSGRSREEVIAGYIDENGKHAGGQFRLFEGVRLAILQEHEIALQEGDSHKADALMKVLVNWPAILNYARMQLRNTESVTFSNNSDYVEEAEFENYGANTLDTIGFNMATSRREHWQDTNELKSSFSSLGAMTRSLLGRSFIYKIEENPETGETEYIYETDDIGFPKTMDPIVAHQNIQTLMRGCQNSTEMMQRLYDEEGNPVYNWLVDILNYLEDNNALKTMFFVDFCKNFQIYSIITKDNSAENKFFNRYKKTYINKETKLFESTYYLGLLHNRVVNPNNISLYNSKGYINWAHLNSMRSIINETFRKPVDSNSNSTFDKVKSNKETVFDTTTSDARRATIIDVCEFLGIDIDYDTADAIAKSKQESRAFKKAIVDLFKYGIDNELTAYHKSTTSRKEAIQDLRNGNIGNFANTKIINFANSKVFKEHINKILDLVGKRKALTMFESSGKWINSRGKYITYYSDINPCFMGDKIEEIKNYVQQNKKKELRKFLEINYLNSSFFAKKNKDGSYTIYNKWLDEMYQATLSDKDLSDNNFCKMFDYERALGEGGNNTVFENYTDKMHMIDMITRFFNQIIGADASALHTEAQYSSFVLGDSNASKYLTAPVYSESEIIKGLYNVFLQEKAKFRLQDATKRKLEGESQKTITNFHDRRLDTSDGFIGEFTMLPFLNPDFKAPDGTIGKYWNEYLKGAYDNPALEQQAVEKAINAYMKDAFEQFKKDLTKMGVDEKSKGVFVNLPSFITNSSYDKHMRTFYWNHKFATIQQLQLFTIDPAFYGVYAKKELGKVFGTIKDLQKRYKQEHAPGRKLDIFARDPSNEDNFIFADKNGEISPIEKAIYFDDVEINNEKTNNSFMEVVKLFYKERTDEYEKYKKSSLTDGQGYRTLTSYRKVQIGLGLWTDKMEQVYQYIKKLREDYWDNGKEIPAAEIEKIAKEAVIFQPKKPILFGFERLAVGDDYLPIPVQHKYAEAVIIPELYQADNKLRMLGKYMDEKGIDIACSTKAVKVGIFGQTDIKSVKNDVEMRESLDKAYVHELNYADWREQTNVPHHMQEARLFGVQIRKLLLSGIRLEVGLGEEGYKNYIEGGKEVNLGGGRKRTLHHGRDLMAFYNSLICANMDDSMANFLEAIGSKEKVADAMIQLILNNNRQSEDHILAVSLENQIDGSGDFDFVMQLYEPGIEHDTSSLLLSMFKKMVNKQTIMGNSLVQVSALGIKGYEEDGDLKFVTDGDLNGSRNHTNIIYAETEVPWDLACNILGKDISLNYEDYVDVETRELKRDPKTGETLIEKLLPGVLDMIAYRIPTEREYSMMRLKIKRFSPPTEGGTIKVPPAATTVAGFDFDIDKLYLIRREFKMKSLTPKQISEIWWEGIYNKGKSDIYKALKKVQEEVDIDIHAAIVEEYSKRFNKAIKLGQGYEDLAAELGKSDEDSRLYDLWEQAGLEGTPEDAFLKYVMEHSDKYVKFEEYDPSLTAKQNSRIARNNMLLDLMLRRLEDRETLQARITPGGFPTASEAARFFRELEHTDLDLITSGSNVDIDKVTKRCRDKSIPDPEPEYDPSDPMTIVRYNQQNQAASKLIGIFANHNTNHAFARLMYSMRLKTDEFGKASFGFAGHNYSDFLNTPEGVDVTRNIAEFLAASVDAVKDPVLNFLNLNTVTADVGATLIRLGYTMKEVGALLNQPVIKRLSTICAERGVSADIAILDVWKELGKNSAEVKYDSDIDFTMDKLCQNIIDERKNAKPDGTVSDAEGQAKVLKMFSSVLAVSQELSKFVTNTKFTAANSIGSTFGEIISSLQKVDQYVADCKNMEKRHIQIQVTDPLGRESLEGKRNNTPIDNDKSLLLMDYDTYYKTQMDNPYAYEQYMYDAIRKMLYTLCGKGDLINNDKAIAYYPYMTSNYEAVRSYLSKITKYGSLDGETINSIHGDFFVYLLATMESSLFNGNLGINVNGQLYKARDYFLKEFPKEFFRYKESGELGDNPLFNYLVPYTEVESGKPVIKGIKTLGTIGDGTHSDAMKEAWEKLYEDNEALARRLFMYCFHSQGFSYSFNTFMHLAPTSLKESIMVTLDDEGNDISYSEFQRMILKNSRDLSNFEIERFVKQYIRNNTHNKKLVFNADMSKSAKSTITSIMNEEAKKKGLPPISASSHPMTFTVEVTNENKNDTKMFVYTTDSKTGITTFRPAILFNGHLYIADGNIEGTFNASTFPRITYVWNEILGKRGVKKHYGFVDMEDSKPTNYVDLVGDIRVKKEQEQKENKTPQQIYKEDSESQLNEYIKESEDYQFAETLKQESKDDGEDGMLNAIVHLNVIKDIFNLVDNSGKDYSGTFVDVLESMPITNREFNRIAYILENSGDNALETLERYYPWIFAQQSELGQNRLMGPAFKAEQLQKANEQYEGVENFEQENPLESAGSDNMVDEEEAPGPPLDDSEVLTYRDAVKIVTASKLVELGVKAKDQGNNAKQIFSNALEIFESNEAIRYTEEELLEEAKNAKIKDENGEITEWCSI